MKKKSELTEPELFYIIHTNESDEEIAEKVGCSKRVVSGIRKANPVQEDVQNEELMNPMDVIKQRTDGKQNVYVMSQGASELLEEHTKQQAVNKKPDTSSFITKIYRK